MHPSLHWIADELEALEAAGLRRRLAVREGAQAAAVLPTANRQPPTTTVNFSANDYLGLAADERLATAAADAATSDGWGAGASPLVTGRSTAHAALEQRLAAFEHAEAALLFPSGFAANAGVIPTLASEGDAIFTDAKNHASIIDGCRLSRARRVIYPHADVDALGRLLEEHRDARRRLIVTDTLFSMDGDFAPLDKLAELADQHNAMLMVDEAHATGVWGAEGRGLVEYFEAMASGVEPRVAVRIGTLSKALGSAGGFVVGDQPLIDYLANRARSYVFSTASPPALAAAATAALDIARDEPERRRTVIERAAWLRQRLGSAGWRTGAGQSQIIPIYVGDPNRAVALSAKLRQAGMVVPAIRPPTVPDGESLVRVSVCYGHSPEHCERLLEALGAP